MARRRDRDGAPAQADPGKVERGGRAQRLLDACERRNIHLALVLLVCVLGILVRLPHAYDEAAYFTHHADEATYFNKAAAFLGTGGGPLAHSGTGFPLFLEQVFRFSGAQPDQGAQQLKNGPYSNATMAAARVAYLADTVLGAGAVGATYWLAAAVVRPAKALLAATLVAFDPFSLFLSGHLMSEQLFTVATVVSFGCAARARRQPAWLLAAGAALAFAAMARGNGVFLVAGLLAYAVLLLRPEGRKGWLRWVLAGAAVFFLVLAPYLAWRASYLPGPFDYGTNTRLFTDDYWNFSDHYWQTYSPAKGGEKETISDYFHTHTLGQAADRLYMSVAWQVQDLFGGAVGHRPHPEGTVLGWWLAFPLAATMLAQRSRRAFWFFPAAAAATIVPFVWTYHLHDSPRYLVHLVPLAAPLAAEGVAWLAVQLDPWTRPAPLVIGFLAAFLGLFAVHPLLDGLGALGHANPSWTLTLLVSLPWLAMAAVAAARPARIPA